MVRFKSACNVFNGSVSFVSAGLCFPVGSIHFRVSCFLIFMINERLGSLLFFMLTDRRFMNHRFLFRFCFFPLSIDR